MFMRKKILYSAVLFKIFLTQVTCLYSDLPFFPYFHEPTIMQNPQSNIKNITMPQPNPPKVPINVQSFQPDNIHIEKIFSSRNRRSLKEYKVTFLHPSNVTAYINPYNNQIQKIEQKLNNGTLTSWNYYYSGNKYGYEIGFIEQKHLPLNDKDKATYVWARYKNNPNTQIALFTFYNSNENAIVSSHINTTDSYQNYFPVYILETPTYTTMNTYAPKSTDYQTYKNGLKGRIPINPLQINENDYSLKSFTVPQKILNQALYSSLKNDSFIQEPNHFSEQIEKPDNSYNTFYMNN